MSFMATRSISRVCWFHNAIGETCYLVENGRMEQGWDPEVKKYFTRILNTIGFFLLWLMAAVTAGLYFRLAYRTEKPLIFVVLYYVCLVGSLLLLLRYYYRVWRK